MAKAKKPKSRKTDEACCVIGAEMSRPAGIDKVLKRLRRRLFFILPPQLLSEVVDRIGRHKFNRNCLKLEREVVALLPKVDWMSGFWNGRLLSYDLLQPPSVDPLGTMRGLAQQAGWNKNPAQLQAIFDGFGEKIKQFHVVARGYCGWLMTNQAFVHEQNALLRKWSKEIRQYGVPRIGLVKAGTGAVPRGWKRAEGPLADFADAFENFFCRWRLESLAAPGLPVPLLPSLPAATTPDVLRCLHRAGALYYFPDTFPIPSRDELRRVLEDVRSRSVPAHLGEWSHIVRAGNQGKRDIQRYGRLFTLQHYWRVLHARHDKALHGYGGRVALRAVFANFLGQKPETIRKDLIFISSRVGKGWHRRG